MTRSPPVCESGRSPSPCERPTAMDFAYILSALPDLMSGLKVTLMVSALAILFSLAIGAARRGAPHERLQAR